MSYLAQVIDPCQYVSVQTIAVIAACCPPLLAEPLSADDAEQLAAPLKALADPTRLRILSLIQAQPDGEACVCHLTGPLDLSQGTVSHHMRVLARGRARRARPKRQLGLLPRCARIARCRPHPPRMKPHPASLRCRGDRDVCARLRRRRRSHGRRKDAPLGHIGVAITFGLVIMAMIYAVGHVSGAHFNAAVTLAFALTRHFPWPRVFVYWGAQFVGALAAAGCFSAHRSATSPISARPSLRVRTRNRSSSSS